MNARRERTVTLSNGPWQPIAHQSLGTPDRISPITVAHSLVTKLITNSFEKPQNSHHVLETSVGGSPSESSSFELLRNGQESHGIDLKSLLPKGRCGFESRPGHFSQGVTDSAPKSAAGSPREYSPSDVESASRESPRISVIVNPGFGSSSHRPQPACPPSFARRDGRPPT